VFVLGGQARSVSLYAAGIAVALGAERVDYVDTSEQRLDIASKLGANAILRTAGRRGWRQLTEKFNDYPIAFDGCGEGNGLEFAIRALSSTGVCTSATPYFRKKTALPLWEMYSRSLRFETGLVDARAHIPDIMNLVASGAFDPSIVTTRLADWQDAPEALLDEGPKVVVTRPRLACI
jgi:alcohol dehydrogenase